MLPTMHKCFKLRTFFNGRMAGLGSKICCAGFSTDPMKKKHFMQSWVSAAPVSEKYSAR